MNILSHSKQIIAPLSILMFIVAAVGCNPPSSKPINMDSGLVSGGEDAEPGGVSAGQLAGEMTAGEITAGEMTAGEMTAGEMTAGEMTAGEMTAGEMTAGEMTAGEMTAGEMTAGEMTAGEMTAGEMTAGEMTAGEMTAGEMTAGSEPPFSLCERYCASFISLCSERSSLKWGEEEQQQSESCLQYCSHYNEGEEGATYGETVACSLNYLSLVPNEGDRACLASDLDEDRPCFDYDARFSETGEYSRILDFGEVSRVRFTLNQPSVVRLIASDDNYCIVNDFSFIIYNLNDPMRPDLIEQVDDYDIEGLDYCPVWVGNLDSGVYEVEVGTYQDQGADLPFELRLTQPELIPIGELCLDAQERPLSWCELGGICEDRRCMVTLTEGEACQLNSEHDNQSRCASDLFCYLNEEHVGMCTQSPTVISAPCQISLDHCPTGSSCVESTDGYRCQNAICGDGTHNEGEECDDGNLIENDGCSSQCLINTRAAIAPPAQFINLIGQINQTSEQWPRPNNDCSAQDPQSNEYLFETRVLSNLTTDRQVLTIEAQWSTFDGFLHIYRGDYETGALNFAEPITDCILGNDDGISGFLGSTLYNIEIEPQESLTIVSSTLECCFIDPDFQGDYQLIVRTHGCGDGYLQENEECDDGNFSDGDGCTSICQVEPYCGDAIVNEGEECDDGNLFNGDGCSTTCVVEQLTGYPIEVPVPGVTIDPHGAVIEGAPLWERPGTFATPCEPTEEGSYAFEYFTLTNQTGFDQVVDINLIPEGEFEDFYLHIFTEPFQPQSPTTGCLTGVDGGGERFVDDRLDNLTIHAGESVAVVVSAYDTSDPPFGYPGSFQLLITTQEPPQVDDCRLISSSSLTLVEGEVFSVSTRVLAIDRTTQTNGIDDSLFVEVGYGPEAVSPDEASLPAMERQWVWHPATTNDLWDDLGDEWSGYDEYQGALVTPSPGEWRVVARASLNGQGWRYCDLGPNDGFQINESPTLTSLPPQDPRLLINEIDYDQSGGDIYEFIELYNPGPARVDLSGLRLSFFDGNTRSEYLTIDLSAGGIVGSGEYFIVGAPLVTDFLPDNVRFLNLNANLQNGGADPDGVRIEDHTGTIYDALAYEGEGTPIIGYTEGQSVQAGDDPSVSPNGSLSRCPNGIDSDNNALDFRLLSQSTPGAANGCP